MAAGLANTLPAPSVAVVPRIEPYLVEVVIPFPLGFQDQAEALIAEKIAELLAQPNLGPALVDAPTDLEDDSPRAADTAFVQGVARLIVAQAKEVAQAALAEMLTKPGLLRGVMLTSLPPDAATPWLNNGVLTVTPDA